MNYLIPLQSFASNYLKATVFLWHTTTALYKALSGDRALTVYKTAWLLAQLAFWASIFAMKQTVRFGQVARKYYEAEWASDVDALVNWFLSYPDQCIQHPHDPLANQEDAPGAIALVNDAPGAIALVETSPIPQIIQVILSSNRSATNKLRAIATQCNINWRNAHGKNKHLSNKEIRSALSSFPAILKQI